MQITYFCNLYIVYEKFLFVCGAVAFMNHFNTYFLAVIDFSMAQVIQGLDLNCNLYLLISFDGACSSKTVLILSKIDYIERFTSCWSISRTLGISLSKKSSKKSV